MPVRTNAAIWREKCMISWRGTRCGDSSISLKRLLQPDLLDLEVRQQQLVAERVFARRLQLVLDLVAIGSDGNESVRGHWCVSSQDVHGAQHLGDARLVLGHEADGLITQRRHSLLDCERAELRRAARR